MKDARPTSGRVLLALFSILNSMPGIKKIDEPDFAFLDIFAGSGRVGMEALKRGAEAVFFVETLKDRSMAIEKELPKGCGTVVALELRRALAWLAKRELSFDVVFADPPYNDGWEKSIAKMPALLGRLKPNGVFVVEHSAREKLDIGDIWEFIDIRSYGESSLTFLKRNESIEKRHETV